MRDMGRMLQVRTKGPLLALAGLRRLRNLVLRNNMIVGSRQELPGLASLRDLTRLNLSLFEYDLHGTAPINPGHNMFAEVSDLQSVLERRERAQSISSSCYCRLAAPCSFIWTINSKFCSVCFT